MRHGDATDLTGQDHDRQLTEQGITKTTRAAQVLKGFDIHFHAIYSSPRLRAQQTAAIIAEVMDAKVILREEVNFGFSLQKVELLIESAPENANILFVGHNPSISDVIHRLTGANINMRKGALARVDLLRPGLLRGELVYLITPKAFKVLATGSDQDEA
ncbi:hypothetical protein MASR2M15_22450 [Anaerolineales bacterium]